MVIIKSKLLRERIAEQEKENELAMKKWWNDTLPRKGSLLRQLVNIQLSKKPLK